MAKYRIVKITPYGESDYFLVQRRILGLFWWTANVRLTQDSAEFYVRKCLNKPEEEIIGYYGT